LEEHGGKRDRSLPHVASDGDEKRRRQWRLNSVRPLLGHLLVSGVFDGEHYFLLEPIGSERTRFTQGEKFSGLLVGLLGGMLSATEAGFKAMNTALKKQAERSDP
jgi:hypothetical protein